MNRTVALTLGPATVLGLLVGASTPASAKDLIEYFKPTPIVGTLSSSAWGAAATGPRDTQNGLEDATLKSWVYWDGQIMRGPDGKYHMYASRWDQSKGHAGGWGKSIAVHAVSDTLIGPYVDKGAAYTDQAGKGHNVTGSMLPDGTWTVIVSDTRPGDIFTSSSIDGPWAFKGSITVNANGMDSSGTAKNLSLVILPDKTYLMATRFGTMMTTPSNLLGPWTVQAAKTFITPAGYPSGSREDPVIWCSGGQYHMVYNYYDLRKARHMVSPDGIKNWKDLGIAYDPTTNFIRYTDGTVNHWYKLERAGVFMENGHVSAFTFAAIDIDKASDLGNDTHGSKVIVVPFDGVTFDTDTGVAGNACSTYSANSGVPGGGATGGTGGSGGTGGTGGSSGTVVRDAGPSDSAIGKDTGSNGGSVGSDAAVVTGGNGATGGTSATGGKIATGGTPATGGNAATGGTVVTGGTSATASTGGTNMDTGGAPAATGGVETSGGEPATGGAEQPTGGAIAITGGTSGTTVTPSSSSGCAFVSGTGASPMSIVWAFVCGLALLIRSRRRR